VVAVGVNVELVQVTLAVVDGIGEVEVRCIVEVLDELDDGFMTSLA